MAYLKNDRSSFVPIHVHNATHVPIVRTKPNRRTLLNRIAFSNGQWHFICTTLRWKAFYWLNNKMNWAKDWKSPLFKQSILSFFSLATCLGCLNCRNDSFYQRIKRSSFLSNRTFFFLLSNKYIILFVSTRQ